MSNYFLIEALKRAMSEAKEIGKENIAKALQEQLKEISQLPSLTFEEVRYGNIITYNNGIKDELCRVITPEKKKCTIQLLTSEKQIEFSASYDKIFPVRLNHHSLESNGWKKVDSDEYNYSNNGYDLFLTVKCEFDDNSFEEMYLTIGDYSFGIIKYCHELQNIMWALKI